MTVNQGLVHCRTIRLDIRYVSVNRCSPFLSSSYNRRSTNVGNLIISRVQSIIPVILELQPVAD